MRMLKTAVAVAALMLTGAAHAQDKVIMRINFTPWAMHAQYYGGVAQGIYKAEGIDLEIRPPSAGQQNEVFIGTGREQFGVANADSTRRTVEQQEKYVLLSALATPNCSRPVPMNTSFCCPADGGRISRSMPSAL